MAVEKNIVMKEFNGTDYDTLYPKTIGTQVDGVFTSEQTLTSDTLAKYQLSASAVPDDVFSWLGKYAQYWWRRRQPTTVYTTTESPSTKQVYIIYKPGSTSATRPINYSDSISVDQSTGTISLVKPQTVDVSYSNRGSTIDGTLAGKYVTNLYTDPSTVYKFATTPTYGRDTSRYSLYFGSGDVTVVSSVATPGYTDWEYVQSNNRNAYPDGESFGYVVDLSNTFTDVYITNAYETRTIYYSSDIGFDSEGTPYLVGETSLSINYNSGTDIFNLLKGKYIRNIWFSNATSADIYFIPAEKTVRPDNGYVVANMAAKVGSKFVPLPPEDGYQYEYIGVPFEKLPMASSVEIGSYAGTGTYGQNNPNTLTFSKKPKLIILGPTNTGGGSVTAGTDNTCIILFGITTGFVFGSSDSINHISYSENTMSWYNDNSATYQQNYQKYKYYYIVIY